MPPLNSLRLRLFVVVAAAITPFVVYGVLTAARSQRAASGLLEEQSLTRARATARSVDVRMQLVDRLLDSAMARVRAPQDSSRTPISSDSSFAALAPLVTVAVLDSAGQRTSLIMGPAGRIDSIPAMRRSSLMTAASAGARTSPDSAPATFVDEGTTRSQKDSVALIVVRPIAKPAIPCNCLADAGGGLIIAVSDRAVQQFLAADSLPGDGIAVMLTANGALLGRPAAAERWLDRDAVDPEELTGNVIKEGTLELQGADGQARAYAYSALARLPWRVYVGLPYSSLAVNPEGGIRDVLLLTLLALGIAALGVVLAWQVFTGPLQTLVVDTKRVASGVFSHRTEIAAQGGEIGELGAAVNVLAAEMESKRRGMLQELRRANMVFDGSPVPMWMADASDDGQNSGRIRQANAAAARLFGVSGAGALVGQKDVELVDAAGAALLDAAVDAPDGSDSATIRSTRTAITTAGGITVPCDLTVLQSPNDQQPTRIVTLQQVLTVDAESAPTPGVAAAVMSAPVPQFETRIVNQDVAEQLATEVANDLDGLFGSVAGFTQMAMETANDPDMQHIAIARIEGLTAEGLSLASRLRSFGKPAPTNLVSLDANESIASALATLKRTLSSAIELDVRYNVAPATVRADALQLQDTVTALIKHARDAMPAGGTMTLATTFVEVPADSSAAYDAPAGHYIVLTVADTGVGMTPATRAQMFEPTSGRGLAGVALAAQEHGWTVSVDSEPQVGTVVSIYMPLVEEMMPLALDLDDQPTLDTTPSFMR